MHAFDQLEDANVVGLGKYNVCFFPNPFQRGLTLRQPPVNLADDRRAAKMLLRANERDEEDTTATFGLGTIGAAFSKRIHRRDVPQNFVPVVHEVMGIHFVYRNYFRTDQHTRYENMMQHLYYLKRHFKREMVRKEHCLDWLNSAPPLAQVIRSRRKPHCRVTMTNTYDCRGSLMVHNRRNMAAFLKHDRGFSPTMFCMSAEAIRSSMLSRILTMKYRSLAEPDVFQDDLYDFLYKNSRWVELQRKVSITPFIYPLRWEPYKSTHSWNTSKDLFDCNGYQNIFSELNQLPPGLFLNYNAVRVRVKMTFEIAQFVPRRLPKKNIPTQEKVCKANEQCYKVNGEGLGIDEPLVPLKMRRSTYSYEPPATVNFAYPGDDDDETILPVAYSLCESDSIESLFSMSGWSSDSFASTATLTPGNATFNWQILSKDLCNSFSASDTAQNPRLWASLARKNHAARQAVEVDERFLMATLTDGKLMCIKSRNPFFRELLAKELKCRLIRKTGDLKEEEQTTEYLLAMAEEMGEKQLNSKRLGSHFLELALRRASHFNPKRMDDRYKGLDISAAWMAAIDVNMFSEKRMDALSRLISSHDSWVTTSPLCDRDITIRCDQLPLESLRPLPAGYRLFFNIGIAISVSSTVIVLILSVYF